MSKNLYDNFRENGSNLRQKPSPRAWKRLESRLDGSQGVQRTLHTRWWIMAASVALLVGAIVGLTMISEGANNQTAQMENGGAFFVSEDLTYTDTKVQNMPSVQLQKRIDNAEWQPINEGEADRRLVAVHINKSPSRGANAEPQIAMIQDITTPQRTTKTKKTQVINADAQEEVKINEPKTTENSQALPAKRKSQQGGAYNNFSDYMWLEGDWKVQKSAYNFTENWLFNGGHELTNSQTPATTARMPFIIGLQCYGVMCNMKMVIDGTGEAQKFEMTDKTRDSWEYWTQGKGYPEVALFEKQNDNNYTLTISGGKVGTAQRKYLTESGFVFRKNGSAVRSMQRVQ